MLDDTHTGQPFHALEPYRATAATALATNVRRLRNARTRKHQLLFASARLLTAIGERQRLFLHRARYRTVTGDHCEGCQARDSHHGCHLGYANVELRHVALPYEQFFSQHLHRPIQPFYVPDAQWGRQCLRYDDRRYEHKLRETFAQQQLMQGVLGDARRNHARGLDDDHQNRDHERVGGRHHRDHALDVALNGRCAQKNSVSVGGADDRSA